MPWFLIKICVRTDANPGKIAIRFNPFTRVTFHVNCARGGDDPIGKARITTGGVESDTLTGGKIACPGLNRTVEVE
jgi:hypothetical protein